MQKEIIREFLIHGYHRREWLSLSRKLKLTDHNFEFHHGAENWRSSINGLVFGVEKHITVGTHESLYVSHALLMYLS